MLFDFGENSYRNYVSLHSVQNDLINFNLRKRSANAFIVISFHILVKHVVKIIALFTSQDM